MSRIRKQFSLRTLIVCIAVFGAILAGYSKLRSESANQIATVAEFESRGGGYYEHEDTPFRIGHWFGLKYPVDKIRLVKGPERADWGMVPGWKCTDSDVGLLDGFWNVEEIYFSNSRLTNISFRQLLDLRKLRKLEFYNCDLTECTMSILADAAVLHKIVLRGSSFDNESLSELQRLAPHIETKNNGG